MIDPVRKVKSARREVTGAQARLRLAIVEAFKSRDVYRCTVEDIAEAAGLTRERVYQIVKEEDRGA